MKWSTQTMDLSFNKEEAILTIKPVESFKGPESIENARENIVSVKDKTGDDLRGVLVYLPPFYINTEATRHYKNEVPMVPLALIGDSFFKNMIGNFLLKFASTARPMKIFPTKEDALPWLQKQMNKKELSESA